MEESSAISASGSDHPESNNRHRGSTASSSLLPLTPPPPLPMPDAPGFALLNSALELHQSLNSSSSTNGTPASPTTAAAAPSAHFAGGGSGQVAANSNAAANGGVGKSSIRNGEQQQQEEEVSASAQMKQAPPTTTTTSTAAEVPSTNGETTRNGDAMMKGGEDPPIPSEEEGKQAASSSAAVSAAPAVSFAEPPTVSLSSTKSGAGDVPAPAGAGSAPPPPTAGMQNSADEIAASTLKDPPPPSPASSPPRGGQSHAPDAAAAAPSALPKRAPGKRPSPWREPRPDHRLPPPAREVQQRASPPRSADKLASMARRRARRERRRYRKLVRDAVTVRIPLPVTADLGIPLRRTRAKRVRAIYERFPELKPEEKEDADAKDNDDANDGLLPSSALDKKLKGDATAEEPDAKTTVQRGRPKKKPIQKLKHVPQPHEYANIIDYLEAKYVQGVMVDDGASGGGGGGGDNTGDENTNADDDEEGGGSVYSETSFLDDSGLQRTVAEQVLGQTTTTKLELEGRDDDDAFFVNVGALEVEENELTQQTYDPLEDTNKKTEKKPRKRKKQQAAGGDNKEDAKKNGKAATSKTAASEAPKKKKTKTSKEEGDTSKTASTEKKKGKTKAKDASILRLQKTAEARKKKVDSLYAVLIGLIKKAADVGELPRKPKPELTKVTVTVPPDKKPGESITFLNPYFKDQKMKCKIPDNLKPDRNFKVSVPKPTEEVDPDKDYNRLNRNFYDTLDTYARSYDEWCDAEGEHRKSTGDSDFNAHFAKREKFDQLCHEFPNKELKTVVDKAYLQKILRRARQNKHKRKLNAQQQKQAGGDSKTGGDDDGEAGSGSDNDNDDAGSNDDNESVSVKQPALKKVKIEPGKKAGKPKKTAIVPHLSLEFMTKVLERTDFAKE